MRSRRRDWAGPCLGFTLLELGVVVAVVGVLMALLLPGAVHAMARGRDVICRSNLRQWGIATHGYAAENGDFLPPDGAPNGESTESGWYVDLPRVAGVDPYHAVPWRTNPVATLPRTLWLCPANRRRSNGHNLFHYCLNENVNGRGVGRRIQAGAIPTPTTTVWLFDNGRLAAVASVNNPHTNLHGAGCHFLFMDGHVERRSARQFWDFVRDEGRWEVEGLRWDPFAP